MGTVLQTTAAEIEYPDSDGRRMSENDLQYRWIVTIRGNLGVLFKDRPDVYVAADHLIYAKEGFPKVRRAPDVYVAFGRPKGDRRSYKVWLEDNVFPQVIFEILAPGNRTREMARKLLFYEKFGAEEYYVYDPERMTLLGYQRQPNGLLKEFTIDGEFVSPQLRIRFDMTGSELALSMPNGSPFLSYDELFEQNRIERERADAERLRADAERERADAERKQTEIARAEVQRLLAKLRAAGLEPHPNGSG